MANPTPATRVSSPLILLIADDPTDAGWLAELIEQTPPGTEVVVSTNLADGLAVLARQPINAVFLSIHGENVPALIQTCRKLVRCAGRRPVVAALEASQRSHAGELRAVGARFVYAKHPIMRNAFIRKQAMRAEYGMPAITFKIA